MARARILKMGFFENEVLAQLPDKARLLYAGLWLIADRSGRLEDRPMRIRAQIFPYEPVDCETLLASLAESGFIRRYESEGVKVIDLPSFLVHQSPHHREPESKLPAFSQSLGSAEACPGLASTLPQPSPPDPVSDPVLVLVSDPVSDRVVGSEPAKDADSEPSPPVLTFPTTGAAKSWGLAAAYIAELQTTYDAVDIVAEARKALTWVNANPTRKKTAKGMKAFLVNWLNTGVRRGDFVRRAVADAAGGEDWFDECQRLHGGDCGGRFKHGLKMANQIAAFTESKKAVAS